MKKIIVRNRWWLIAAAWVYTLTFLFNHYWSNFSTIPSISKSFEKKIATQVNNFDAFCADTVTLRNVLQYKLKNPGKPPATNNDYIFYLYEDEPDGLLLKYWSDAAIIPPLNDVPYTDTIKLVKYANGYFVMSAKAIKSMQLIAVQLIPVKWEYFITNENLPQKYPGFSGLEKHINISEKATAYPVKLPNGKAFYLQPKNSQPIEIFNWLSFLIQLVATCFLVIFFNRVASGLAAEKRFFYGLLVVLFGACVLRALIYFIQFPINFEQVELFQQVKGHKHFFISTLGSFFLNLLVILWIFSFLRRCEPHWVVRLENKSKTIRSSIALLSIVLLVAFVFLITVVTKELILHPRVSFDISNFFSLGWNTLFAIICLYVISIISYIYLHLSNNLFVKLWPYRKLHKFFLVAIIGLLALTFLLHVLPTRLLLLVLLWVILSLLLEDWIPQQLLQKIGPSTNFLFWTIWYALSGMFLILAQNNFKEAEQRLRMAEDLASQSDPTVEQRLVNALNSNEVRDISKNFGLFQDSAYNNAYLNSLHKQYFSDYLVRYETVFYLFDANKNPLYNKDSISFEALNTIVNQVASKTNYPGIYYYQRTFETSSYIIRDSLVDVATNQELGYLFITTTSVRNKGDALVPELLKELQENNLDYASNYSFAVYDKGTLISSNKDFPFITELSKEDQLKSEKEDRRVEGSDQLWYNAGNGRTIVVVRSGSTVNDAITLFAYLFGTFIVLTLIENLILSLVIRKKGFKWSSIRVGKFSIKGQIQNTILMVSFVSFMVIGFVTIIFFIYRFRQNNTNRLTKIITQVNDDLQKNTEIKNYKEASLYGKPNFINEEITAFIDRVAELQNVNINLFSTDGDLMSTSVPIIFEKGIMSMKMNHLAFYELSIKKKVQVLQSEVFGTLPYASIYVPVRTEEGQTVAFLNVLYFSSQNDLNQEISNFLVALINFNAFIFLLSGIISFFITSRITSSFSLIGEKMKAVGLGKKNEHIIWDRNDEIGILVLEYNKMIAQLDDSAQKLARNERESAWREMAKQVAHEIKNPLTPMKLSLQFLQRAIDNGAPNLKEMVGQMAGTLVEQINHLSRIASDFSQFAQIGLARAEVFDLHEVIRQVAMLYENDSNVLMGWDMSTEPVYIEADKTQINRLFTNLLQNACEASVENTSVEITIGEEIKPSSIIIRISDKGSGIPENLHDHIFVPNFTTKSSGTGLGLAMCRDIVEKANGTIWFETVNGEGTTFFIQLPIKTMGSFMAVK